MTGDIFSIILSGISTGTGVVIAQYIMGWIKKHPIIIYVEKKTNNLIGIKEKGGETWKNINLKRNG